MSYVRIDKQLIVRATEALDESARTFAALERIYQSRPDDAKTLGRIADRFDALVRQLAHAIEEVLDEDT